jgi:hypothetical protein
MASGRRVVRLPLRGGADGEDVDMGALEASAEGRSCLDFASFENEAWVQWLTQPTEDEPRPQRDRIILFSSASDATCGSRAAVLALLGDPSAIAYSCDPMPPHDPAERLAAAYVSMQLHHPVLVPRAQVVAALADPRPFWRVTPTGTYLQRTGSSPYVDYVNWTSVIGRDHCQEGTRKEVWGLEPTGPPMPQASLLHSPADAPSHLGLSRERFAQLTGFQAAEGAVQDADELAVGARAVARVEFRATDARTLRISLYGEVEDGGYDTELLGTIRLLRRGTHGARAVRAETPFGVVASTPLGEPSGGSDAMTATLATITANGELKVTLNWRPLLVMMLSEWEGLRPTLPTALGHAVAELSKWMLTGAPIQVQMSYEADPAVFDNAPSGWALGLWGTDRSLVGLNGLVNLAAPSYGGVGGTATQRGETSLVDGTTTVDVAFADVLAAEVVYDPRLQAGGDDALALFLPNLLGWLGATGANLNKRQVWAVDARDARQCSVTLTDHDSGAVFFSLHLANFGTANRRVEPLGSSMSAWGPSSNRRLVVEEPRGSGTYVVGVLGRAEATFQLPPLTRSTFLRWMYGGVSETVVSDFAPVTRVRTAGPRPDGAPLADPLGWRTVSTSTNLRLSAPDVTVLVDDKAPYQAAADGSGDVLLRPLDGGSGSLTIVVGHVYEYPAMRPQALRWFADHGNAVLEAPVVVRSSELDRGTGERRRRTREDDDDGDDRQVVRRRLDLG